MSGVTLLTRVTMPSTCTSASMSLGSRSRMARSSARLYGRTLMGCAAASSACSDAWLAAPPGVRAPARSSRPRRLTTSSRMGMTSRGYVARLR